jgi:hypothetical protein
MPEGLPAFESEPEIKIENQAEGSEDQVTDKGTYIGRFIDRKIIEQNATGEFNENFSPEVTAAIGKEFAQYFTVRERTELLYEKVIAYIKTRQALRREHRERGEEEEGVEGVDPYIIAEISALWRDEAVRARFTHKYAESRRAFVDAKTNPFGRELEQVDEAIQRLEADHEQIAQKLFLKTAGDRIDVESGLKSRVAFISRQLNAMRQRKEELLNLERGIDIEQKGVAPQEVVPTPEITDTLAAEQYKQLCEYRAQAKEGFVWLPHFKRIKQEIINHLQNGRWPSLVGEAGTGKSELADAAAVALTGEMPTHVACDSRTSVQDILVDKHIEHGTSYEEYGPAMQAATGYDNSLQKAPTFPHGRIVRFDEWGRLGERVYSKLKELRQLRPGRPLEDRTVLPGFAAIMTTNPPGTRYPGRTAPDAAMRREIGEISVDYAPQSNLDPEVYEFMLQAFMDPNYHINAAQTELSPFYEYTSFEPSAQIAIDEKRKGVGQDRLVENPTDRRHGIAWRLAFAIRELQNAFNYGNKVDVPDAALRFKEVTDRDGKPTGRLEVVASGGEQLTLSNTTITLGELAKMMSGFNERYTKDDPDFHTKTLTEWVQYKLGLFLEQTDADDREKVRAIFNFYHLFEAPPTIVNAYPLTPKDIGYLSPRVKRPLIIETVAETTPAKEDVVREASRTFESLTNWTAVLTDGTEAKYVKDEAWQFSRDEEPSIDVRSGVSFTYQGERYIFAGRVEDSSSIHNGKLLAKLAHEDLYDVFTREQIEQGEDFTVSVELAKQLLDGTVEQELGQTNVFGRDEIQKALGFEVGEIEIPPIPYSKERLERAQQEGQMLVLRISSDASGRAMTMQRIHEITEPLMQADEEGKLLFNVDWYKEEAFYTNESLKTEWKLVGKEFVPGTKNKNYVEQTKLLRDYLKSTGDLTRAEEIECSDERLREIERVMAADWQQASLMLSNLLVNENHRRSAAEAAYDWLVRFRNNDTRGELEHHYDWTNTRSSDGDLVHFGGVDGGGASVDRGG